MRIRILGAFLLCAAPAWALGPHEILLLINDRSADSIEIGEAYAAMRQVPTGNVVRVSVPDSFMESDTISAADFERLIWKPAQRQAAAQGVSAQVLAWVYAAGFPVRVSTEPPISVLGLTFMRNQLPDLEEVDAGRYASPLFAGPMGARSSPHQPQTLDMYAAWLGRDMPLPAMMLGYTRPPHGNAVATVLACLRRGLESDSTAPTGDVYFVATRDVRSVCRAWQHGGAADDLAPLRVRAVLTNAEPARAANVLGLQIGEAIVHPGRFTYLPGAMADHLTSAGAVLHQNDQTKLTAWIEAGATASAGTVTEPYAIWAKFPSAHFYYFYASGCTMLESFYQSVRCPLQLLLLGDPLASPWKPAATLTLTPPEPPPAPAPWALRPLVRAHSGFDYGSFRYYLDGVQVHEGPTFSLETGDLPAGPHHLRVVAYRTGLVRQQVFTEQAFEVGGTLPVEE